MACICISSLCLCSASLRYTEVQPICLVNPSSIDTYFLDLALSVTLLSLNVTLVLVLSACKSESEGKAKVLNMSNLTFNNKHCSLCLCLMKQQGDTSNYVEKEFLIENTLGQHIKGEG